MSSSREEAVSPVIAVILMVAITVILAAVVYGWVSVFADAQTTPRSMGVANAGANATSASYIITSASPSLEWGDLVFALDGDSASETIPEGLVKAGDKFSVYHPSISGKVLTIVDEPANSVILTLKMR